jgi:hypothetical protein
LTLTGDISILWPIFEQQQTMRRTKHVIAVMVVATALCADRAIASAPTSSRSAPARSLASRITTSFRQTVPAVRLQPGRTMESAASHPLPICEIASGVRSEFSPFQFRLPPPIR